MKAHITLTTMFLETEKSIKNRYLLSIYSYWYLQSLMQFFPLCIFMYMVNYFYFNTAKNTKTLNFLLLLKKINSHIRDAKANQPHSISIKNKYNFECKPAGTYV